MKSNRVACHGLPWDWRSNEPLTPLRAKPPELNSSLSGSPFSLIVFEHYRFSWLHGKWSWDLQSIDMWVRIASEIGDIVAMQPPLKMRWLNPTWFARETWSPNLARALRLYSYITLVRLLVRKTFLISVAERNQNLLWGLHWSMRSWYVVAISNLYLGPNHIFKHAFRFQISLINASIQGKLLQSTLAQWGIGGSQILSRLFCLPKSIPGNDGNRL